MKDTEYHDPRRSTPDTTASRLRVLLVGSLMLWLSTIVTLLVRPDFIMEPASAQNCNGLQLSTASSSITITRNHETNTTDGVHAATLPHATTTQSPPGVVWLMSYPNSGTSYTLRVINEVSQRSTASNYGEENLRGNGNNSLLIHTNWTNGPFRSVPPTPLPDTYILTKTHCGSRCVTCGPNAYIETQRSFLRACLSGHIVKESTRESKYGWEDVMYNAERVKGAVHLIRNPLNNVVSRYHLAIDHAFRNHNQTLANNAVGFRDWCRQSDYKHIAAERKEKRLLDANLQHLWQSIPCHQQFFEYIQWHNLAWSTGQFIDIPVHTVHYEEYETDWRGTIGGVLDFLQQDPMDWNEASPFHASDYGAYYTAEEKVAIRAFLQDLAAVPVWEMIQQYFDETDGTTERKSHA